MVAQNWNTSAFSKLTLCFMLTLSLLSYSQSEITNLKVEYLTNPLGIDISAPRFSWQLVVEDNQRGYSQTAYQIMVVDERQVIVWDSGKILSDVSLGITYFGEPLMPTMRYDYTITIWDNSNNKVTNTAWFETGLLETDPKSAAWNGAQWIGGADEDLVLSSHYLSVYKIDYKLQLDRVSKSTKAAFVFGGNDRRLMDKNKNIQGVSGAKNENYIAFELDINPLLEKKEGLAKFNVYRVGYDKTDQAQIPFKTFDIPNSLINQANKYDKHQFHVACNFGIFEVFLGAAKEENKLVFTDEPSPSPFAAKGMNLNPVGKGNNYISFPMVGDIGFWMNTNQNAFFSEVQLRNYRAPANILFSENLDSIIYDGIFKTSLNNEVFSVVDGSYHIKGGTKGALLLANPSKNAAPMLRTEFNAENKKIKKARLYITSRGIYEAYLNGKRVGEDYFNPGLTQYNKTHMYQTYDVTSLLNVNGANALGMWLSEGWWSGNITYSGENWNYFGDRQSALVQLVIFYDDGSKQVITSNKRDWKIFTDGPIRFGSFFQGEIYDSTKEIDTKGWDTPDFDDSKWKPVTEVPLEGTSVTSDHTDFEGKDIALNYSDQQISAQLGENARVVKTLTAIGVNEVRPGVYVYDMGQNMVGVPQINLFSGNPGDTITLRYAEVLYPNLPEYSENVGMVMLENIRAALTQDIHIRNGSNETIQPRFTFHGYRFVEITGINAPLPIENVKGLVISSINELASSYETSNELVNKLWENVTWSLRGNFLSIPTDTPARNERMGWSGDINVFAKAATYLANVEPFLRRHLLAMRDIQELNGRFTDVAPVGGGFGGTLWGSAGIVVPWEVYQQYGDLELLREHYEAMKNYSGFLASKQNELGILDEGPLGDWLSPENTKNDNTALWNAYQVYNLDILAKTAHLLGKDDDAKDLRKQYDERKTFFNKTYIDPISRKSVHTGHAGFRFGPPPEQRPKSGAIVDTQASYAIPLGLDVFNEENKPFAIEHLVQAVSRKNKDDNGVERPEYSLMTGFIGTASLNEALSHNGQDVHAYRLLQQTSYPSWLYSVVNGASTIWERLNSYTEEEGFGGNNSMNSFNHYSFGAVLGWMYNYSLGIQRDSETPGFKHFILNPKPDPDRKMTWAKGHYDSMYGRIESKWKWMEDGWSYTTTVPGNTSATLYLHTNSVRNVLLDGKKVKQGKGIQIIEKEGDRVVLELVSGKYNFKIKE